MATKLLRARRLGAVSLVAVPLLGHKVYASDDVEGVKKVAISQLPVYGNPEQECKIIPEEINQFRAGISSVRSAVWGWLDSIQGTTDKVKDKYEIGKAHTESTIDYIRNDPGVLPRLGVITVSGVGGIILGYRGGLLRKTAYSTFAILTASALCYPKEAVAISTAGLEKITKPITDAIPEKWKSKKGKDDES